jgi:ERCC4-type nuclease
VLDFVLERKSSQDLSASISDGRYVAQKWRMLQCGLANRFYLVETDGDCLLPDSRSKVRGSNQCRAVQNCMHASLWLGQKGAHSVAQRAAGASAVPLPTDWQHLPVRRQLRQPGP